MARLSPYTFSQEFDNNGNPLSGGKIYTYEAGTTTPKVTYSDSEGTIPNSNPIILDAAGRYQAWLDSGAYKMVLKTSADVTIDTRDDVAGDTANAFGSSVVVISGNLSVTTVYRNAAIIATASATLSLLPRATAEESFYFAIKNASASGTVTIDPELTETIDGVSTVTLSPGQSCIVIAGATEWKTLFLPASTQYFSVAQALTTAGIIVKNNSGVNVATFGASGGTNTSLAGNVDVTGTLSAVASLALAGNSTTPAFITLAEDTDNGTNKATIIAPASISSDYTVTLPSTAGTLALTSQLPTRFVSTAQTITAAGSLTIAHGLGSTPIEFGAYLTCTTNDAGYTVGARVPYYPMAQGNNSAVSNSGVTINADATNLNIRFGQSVSPSTIFINNATTGNLTGITNSSWTITFVARP